MASRDHPSRRLAHCEESAERSDLDCLAHRFGVELGDRPGRAGGGVVEHHVGFAERARRELGVPVYAHEREVPVTKHPWRYDHERSRIPYMLKHPGFDRAFFAMAGMGALLVKGVGEVRTYADGEELDVPGRPLVIFTPGHTHGHCALHLAGRGAVIAGDALVTYNPYRDSHGPQIVSGAATAILNKFRRVDAA